MLPFRIYPFNLNPFKIKSNQNWIPSNCILSKLNPSRNNSLQIESIQSWIPSKLNSFRTIPFRIESLPNWSLSKSNPFNIWSLENWILWKLKGSINEISLFKSESLQIFVCESQWNQFLQRYSFSYKLMTNLPSHGIYRIGHWNQLSVNVISKNPKNLGR